MRISNFFNAVIGVFLFAGCSSTYYYADFINPSEVYIPTKIYAVGIMNRGADATLVAPIYTDGVAFDYIAGLPKKMADKTLMELNDNISNLDRFKFVNIKWDVEPQTGRKFMADPFTNAEIDSLCNLYKVDGIISLEGVDLSIRTNGDVHVVSAVDQYGMNVRVPEFSSNQQVSYTVGWRFYDGLELKPIDLYQETYQMQFNRVAYDPEEASKVNPDDMQIMDIAKRAAFDYQNRISPHFETGYRLYYRGGTVAMGNISRDLEANGNWKAAAEAWTKLVNSKDQNEAYYANYNMAVASEMLGHPRVSKDWLEKAIAVKNRKQAMRYMELIKKQIVIYDVVDHQLGL